MGVLTVAVSGGFDPCHFGHLRLLKDASQYGHVIVILNSDEWLVRKKGFFHLSWQERAAILAEMRCVSDVIEVDDSDNTVCDALRKLRPTYFANGGDRGKSNTPELALCEGLGIEPLWNIGGEKYNSSSAVSRRAIVERNWGEYHVLAEGPWFKIKKLILNPKAEMSIQKHDRRTEHWFYENGEYKLVESGEWHSLHNPWDHSTEIIELQIGDCSEDDIERL